jgi:hypothetical protein
MNLLQSAIVLLLSLPREKSNTLSLVEAQGETVVKEDRTLAMAAQQELLKQEEFIWLRRPIQLQWDQGLMALRKLVQRQAEVALLLVLLPLAGMVYLIH